MTNQEIRAVQRDLALLISGSVLDSGDLGYTNTISIDNSRVTHEPYLVALPADQQDVSKIVAYCHLKKIPFTTKAGGHSATGYCLNSEGIVLDLVNLNSITKRNGGSQLSIGAGTRWIKVYNYLKDQQSPYTVIGGGCAGVGVAGFILGGGYSFISRSYGLGSDNVVGLQFVSGDGMVHELSDASTGAESDLYWALRGCGGGNFGVVTRLDLQLQETPEPRQMMGQMTFPFYRMEEILRFYNKWVLDLPDEMAVYGMMRRFPDPRRGGEPSLTLRFTPIYNGTLARGIELLKPLTEQTPSSVELYSMNLPEWENFIGTATQIKGHSAYIRSSILSKGGFNEDVALICKKYMSRAPSPDSYVVWTHTGGKIRKLDVGSYAHREAEFTLELKSIWNSAQPEQARPNIEWAVRFFDELKPHSTGAYINYIDPLELDWQARYYNKQYDPLLLVRDKWDSQSQFKFQQGIGSTYITAQRGKPLDLSPLTRTF